MLHRELTAQAQAAGGAPFLSSPSRKITYSEALQSVGQLVASLPPCQSRRVGVRMDDSPESILLLIALDCLGADVFLIGRDAPGGVVDGLGLHLTIMASDFPVPPPKSASADSPTRHDPAASGSGHVTLFTSGTSGPPKGALHTWASLAAGIKRDPRFANSRWLLTYSIVRFAGLQVFLQCLLNRGCLVFPGARDPATLAELMATERVQCVSGTPTFWRKLLTMAPRALLARLNLTQITLGGEIVGQSILNSLRAAFPSARLTHIYASTEMGVCFAVHDGLEGFPTSVITHGSEAADFRVDNGELLIRSRRAMSRYLDGPAPSAEWFPTGDLVEISGDRVRYLGRRSEIINVGGNKVCPSEIEDLIRQVPGVQDCRVFGTSSSFAGQLVSAEIVPAPGEDQSLVRARVLQACGHLASHKRPRLLTFIPFLKENDSTKIDRRRNVP